MLPEIPTANIHHFDGSTYDLEGNVLLGYYFELIDSVGDAVSGIIGPYSTAAEAEEACQRAFDKDDY